MNVIEAPQAGTANKQPVKNAYGQSFVYTPQSPIPEMRDLLVNLMATHKEIRFDVLQERKIFNGYSAAQHRLERQPNLGTFAALYSDRFFYNGIEYTVTYNEMGASLFNADKQLRTEKGDFRPGVIEQAAERLLFTNGDPKFLDVRSARDMKLAEHLLHCSMCSSFPWRNPQVMAWYELHQTRQTQQLRDAKVRAAAEFTIRLQDSQLPLDALRDKYMQLIHKTSERSAIDLRGVYDIREITDELYRVGMLYPVEALAIMESEDDNYSNLVRRATALNLIGFDNVTRFWVRLKDGQPYRDNEIFRVSENKDPGYELMVHLKAHPELTKDITRLVLEHSQQ